MQTIFSQFRHATLLMCLSMLWPVTAPAQTGAPASAPASLSADAQGIVNKGIIAARQQDYPLAIRYFNDARKIAPDAAAIYFDLGLAESKIPGRELRAIAWLSAYLAVNPHAPNAAAVRDQIGVLDVKGQGNVSRVLTSIQEQADQNAARLIPAAGLWAEAGDLAAAFKLVDRIQDAGDKGRAKAAIAKAQVSAGDMAGALKTANQIQAPDLRSTTQAAIALAQGKAHDISGARNVLAMALESINQIQSGSEKSTQQTNIARILVKMGDVAGAKKMLATALKTANQISNEGERDIPLTAVAEALSIIHDKGDNLTSPQIVLADALKAAGKTQDELVRSLEQSWVATAQMRTGDTADAIRTLAIAGKSAVQGAPEHIRVSHQSDIAMLQSKAGDIAGALMTVSQISQPYARSFAQIAVAEAQVKMGDIAGARKTLANALKTASPDQSALGKRNPFNSIVGSKRRALAGIAGVFVKLDDVERARNTLASAVQAGDQSDDPHERVLARSTVAAVSAEIDAEIQIKAGDFAGAINSLMAALKASDGMSYKAEKIAVLLNVAGLLVKAGDIAGARSNLEAALDLADQIQQTDEGRNAQFDITEALAKLESPGGSPSAAAPTIATQASMDPAVQTVAASDWLRRLDDIFVYGECPLNTDLFLDLAGHLRALPSADDPDETFAALSDTAERLVNAQNVVDRMLKQQAKQQANP